MASTEIDRYRPLRLPDAPAEETALRLRLIGPMEARTTTGEDVLPTGRNARALLAILALAAPHHVLRSQVVNLLWSTRPEERAQALLRVEIRNLQLALARAGSDIIGVTRDHLTLHLARVCVDVIELRHAKGAIPLALGSDTLLEDLDGLDPVLDTWLTAERQRLRNSAIDIAATLLKKASDPDSAMAAANQPLQIDGTHEAAGRALLEAHASRDDQGAAMQLYQRYRATSASTLRVEPSTETENLIKDSSDPHHDGTPPQPRQLPAPIDVPLDTLKPIAEPCAHLPPPPMQRPHQLPPKTAASLAILPFRLTDPSRDAEPVAAGLANDITTALSHFRELSVSVFPPVIQPSSPRIDAASIHHTHNPDFLLDGSLQSAGDQLRTTVRLIDPHDANRIVWARRFDQRFENPLTLQNEVSAQVAAQIDPQILMTGARHSATKPDTAKTAHDRVLCAIPLMWRMQRIPFMQASEYLSEAISQHPDYATAHAWYAYWNVFLIGQGWAPDPKAAMQACDSSAHQAMVLDPYDARALTIAGHVAAFLHRRLDDALALHERALSLNPNLAMAWALSSCAYAYMGERQEAERHHERYRTLSPLNPQAFFYDTLSIYIHLQKSDFETAVAIGRRASGMNPSFMASHRLYLAALGHTKRAQEAATVRRHLLALEPDFSIERFRASTPLQTDSDLELLAEGLSLAGVPQSTTQTP